MNRNPAFCLGAAALVALLLIGCQSIGSASPSGEPSTSAAPSTTEPGSSDQASPSMDPNDTSAWLPFDSERYGLGLAYPPDWTANHGDGDWTFPEDTAWPDGVGRTDWFEFDAPEGTVAASAWSVALEPGTSAHQWWLDYCTVEVTPCDGTESEVDASLHGNAGWLVDASDPAAYFGVGGRIYLLTVWQPDDFETMERYGSGLAITETWPFTVRLLPD